MCYKHARDQQSPAIGVVMIMIEGLEDTEKANFGTTPTTPAGPQLFFEFGGKINAEDFLVV